MHNIIVRLRSRAVLQSIPLRNAKEILGLCHASEISLQNCKTTKEEVAAYDGTVLYHVRFGTAEVGPFESATKPPPRREDPLMDAKVSDDFDRSETDAEYDNFLLREGLEVLASYRLIRDETVKLAVKQLIDALAKANLPPN